MKKTLLTSGTLAALALPFVSFAQTSLNNISDVGSFIINIINNIAIPVLFAIAFIVFLWGAFDAFIAGAQNEDVKERGKNLMLWGLIGFFVMLSVWGLVNILTGSVNLKNNITPPTSGITVPSSL